MFLSLGSFFVHLLVLFPDYVHPLIEPYRPWYIRLVNVIGRYFSQYLGVELASFDIDSLKQAASAAAGGLTDFGDEVYAAPLNQIVAEFFRAGEPTFMGKLASRMQLVDALALRLRFVDYFKQHPEIFSDENRVDRPVFIVSHPRSGSTLVNNMLAAHDELRTPHSWELMKPFPRPELVLTLEHQANIDEIQGLVSVLDYIVPDMQAIHPIDPYNAEEGEIVLNSAIASPLQTPMSLGFHKWLMVNRDTLGSAAVDWMDSVLRYFQSAKDLQNGRRWVIKTTTAGYLLEDIFERFPDAAIINLHRDPDKAHVCTRLSRHVTQCIPFFFPCVHASDVAVELTCLMFLATFHP